MARPVKHRRIISPYSDQGVITPGKITEGSEGILLLTEELEAVKLIDYEGLDHAGASELMQVSRPTFTRIYKRARVKIAISLVENRHIVLSEGNIYFNDVWNKCLDCESIFNIDKNTQTNSCPVCESSNSQKQ